METLSGGAGQESRRSRGAYRTVRKRLFPHHGGGTSPADEKLRVQSSGNPVVFKSAGGFLGGEISILVVAALFSDLVDQLLIVAGDSQLTGHFAANGSAAAAEFAADGDDAV